MLGGDACPSCVAVLQRRLRHDASDLPSERRSRWERATPAVLRDSTEEQEWRATRGDRAVRRGHKRALDGKTRGAALRTTGGRTWAKESGSASEGGGARDERQSPWQGSGPQDLEAPPREPEHRTARRRRDSARNMAKPQNRSQETAENGQEHTPQRIHGPRRKSRDARQESRPSQEREGPGPRQGFCFRVQGVPKGRERPTSPNLFSHSLTLSLTHSCIDDGGMIRETTSR